MEDHGVLPPGVGPWLKANYCSGIALDPAEARRIVIKYMLAFLRDLQPVLTPGHALTREPNVEFFISEKRNPNAIDEDWPDLFSPGGRTPKLRASSPRRGRRIPREHDRWSSRSGTWGGRVRLGGRLASRAERRCGDASTPRRWTAV